MERLHKRCCFKRSSSICKIKEIQLESREGSSIELQSGQLKEPRYPTKNVLKRGLGRYEDAEMASKAAKSKIIGDECNSKSGISKIFAKVHKLFKDGKKPHLDKKSRKNDTKRRCCGGKYNEVDGINFQLEDGEIRKLIRLYCKHDSLYNPQNTYYGNKEFDEDCFVDMARSFPKMNSYVLRSYLYELRNLFEREYTTIETARRNYGEILMPSIKFYNEFLFLVPHLNINFDQNQSRNHAVCCNASDLGQQRRISAQRSIEISNLISGSNNISVSSFRRKSTIVSNYANSERETVESACQQFQNIGRSISKTFTAVSLHHAGGNSFKSFCCKKPEVEELPQQSLELSQETSLNAEVLEIQKSQCSSRDTIGSETSKQTLCICKSHCEAAQGKSWGIEQIPTCPNSQVAGAEAEILHETTILRPTEPVQQQPQQKRNRHSMGTNEVQVQMLCDMIRMELMEAPDFIYYDAKWRIIEILREVHKRQLVHMKSTPQNEEDSSSAINSNLTLPQNAKPTPFRSTPPKVVLSCADPTKARSSQCPYHCGR